MYKGNATPANALYKVVFILNKSVTGTISSGYQNKQTLHAKIVVLLAVTQYQLAHPQLPSYSNMLQVAMNG